ncbi:WecB/TagA/CpsF family glycosyltransferase [Rhodoligotrophos ferricapiens]|uniref:WecB/TagA/CpsF family glycosyltransferase n=1 Tax=Rhodoligotrophos ferricapiens TaxID=3069264 RepID=UPI00315D0A21
MTLPTVMTGNLPVVCFDRAQWAEHLLAKAQRRRGAAGASGSSPAPFYTSANGHVLSRAAADPAFRALLDDAEGIDADGMPLVFASRALGGRPLPERCATTDFFHDLAARAQQTGVSFYFLGGTPQANAAAMVEVRRLYPGLPIAGAHHGYFAPAEEKDLVSEINRARPDILWVGLGVPNEQAFAARNRAQLTEIGLIKTCGGLFDFLCGARRRAPLSVQRIGCEWLYRLALEPRRLFRRYAITNPHAAWLLLTATATPIAHMTPVSPKRQELSWLDEIPVSL